MSHPLADASSRVAFAACLHDLGKFAERARVYHEDPRLDAHLTLYCPFHQEGRWFSHQHAAHTALAMTELEPQFPELLLGETYPFAGRQTASDTSNTVATDSLANAAAAHHKPDTFLQWIVATADRVASGFEREEFERYNQASEKRENGLNHYTSRQLTLFEQVRLNGVQPSNTTLEYRYPLRPLSPRSTFPAKAATCETRDKTAAQAEYRMLWDSFVTGLAQIPGSHRQSWALWLDHFDTLWLTSTHAIPAATAFGVRPEVSLYDHSRAAAALAVALWRWHEAEGKTDKEASHALRSRSDFTEQKFLILQGDFFGIQDFIFAAGGETRKQAAKLLRGRSFQVSLFTELAALRILDELGLPPTSQIINAAGKFMIVAPKTEDTLTRLASLKAEFEAWFVEHTFGQAGVGLAWTPASCADFLRSHGERNENTPFSRLMTRLRQQLDVAKHQRLGLCSRGGKAFHDVNFADGVCDYNGRLPADRVVSGIASCALSRDQITIGETLVKLDRILVVRNDARETLKAHRNLRVLETGFFGHVIAFTADADATGRFGELAAKGALRRCWDFSLPRADNADGQASLWNGFARRFISGYVPLTVQADLGALRGRYEGLLSDDTLTAAGELKTFDMLACEDRHPTECLEDHWQGVAALGVLKGDIDNLGELFRIGLQQPTFAKMAALSRQVNSFFALYLPWLLAREFPNVYTVFAGGDDFFLIGPWRNVQKLAARLRSDFAEYVAGNPDIHFSAGIATQKPGAPLHSLSDLAETALSASKAHSGKNAVTCFGDTLGWQEWPQIEQALQRLTELRTEMKLSTGFVYGLLQLVDMRRREKGGEAEAAMWRPRLAYRTRRFVVDKQRRLSEDERRMHTTRIIHDIGGAGIETLGPAYRIVLFNHLYQFRDR